MLDLAQQCKTAAARVGAAEQRAGDDARQLDQARRTSLKDRDTLNDELATAGDLGSRCRLDRRPPGPVTVSESEVAHAPTGMASPTTATASGPKATSPRVRLLLVRTRPARGP